MSNPVQYIILNPDLQMSTGKAAAQAAHASNLGLLTHVDNDTRRSPYNSSIVNRWMMGGHYAKVVLQATDLATAERYLNDRGFKTALVIDEGRTEVDALTPTAIGTGIVDKDQGHVRATFGEFKLYADSNPSDEWVLERARKLNDDALRKAVGAYTGRLDCSRPNPNISGPVIDMSQVSDDDDPVGSLEGPGFRTSDWLTAGALRNAAVPDATLGTFNPSPPDPQHRIRAMFRRVRERLGEAELDEGVDHL